MIKYKVYYKNNSRIVTHYFNSFSAASGQATALAGQGVKVRIGATINESYSGTMYQYENGIRFPVNTIFIQEVIRQLNKAG